MKEKEFDLSKKIEELINQYINLKIDDRTFEIRLNSLLKQFIRRLFCKTNQVGFRESKGKKRYKIFMIDEEKIDELSGKSWVEEE